MTGRTAETNGGGEGGTNVRGEGRKQGREGNGKGNGRSYKQ